MGKENNAPSSGQLRAIQESGQNLIVSAAAGSDPEAPEQCWK